MASSISGAFTKDKTDELYTPQILVDVILPHLKIKSDSYIFNRKKKPIIWCPFDTENSEFVLRLQEENYDVVYSHINNGQDFFEYEPKEWMFAISNPPFSCKLEVFKRLNSFRKPWAMIMNVMALNYHEIIEYFVDNPVELLFVDKRVSFNGGPSSFGSCYVCNDFLRNDVVFAHIEHNNAKQYFNPSRMYNAEQLMKFAAHPALDFGNIKKRYKKATK